MSQYKLDTDLQQMIEAIMTAQRNMKMTLQRVEMSRSKAVQRPLRLVKSGATLPFNFRYEERWTEPNGGSEDVFQHTVYAAEECAFDDVLRFHNGLEFLNSTDAAVREFTRILTEDWFVNRVGRLQPMVRLEPDLGYEAGAEILGETFADLNLIGILNSLPPAKMFAVLVHELGHLVVRSPYPAHGRLFNHVHAWIWSHLDQRFGTNHAEWLLTYYALTSLPFMPREFDPPTALPTTLFGALEAHPYLQIDDYRDRGGCFWVYDLEHSDSVLLRELLDVLKRNRVSATFGERKKGWRAGQVGLFFPRYFKDRTITAEFAQTILNC